MPRAQFDTTCDIIYGPSGSIPNTVYATVDCRLVPEKFEIPLEYPISQRTCYVTMQGITPNQALVTTSGASVTTDYDYADRLAVPGGAAAGLVILFTELVTYRGNPQYLRAHCSPLPIPPIAGQWHDTFTVATSQLLDVHSPDIGSGGYVKFGISDGFLTGGSPGLTSSVSFAMQYYVASSCVLAYGTLEFLFKVGLGYLTFAWRGDDAAWIMQQVGPGDGDFQFEVSVPGDPQTGLTTLVDGTLYQVVVTDDGNTVTATVNGLTLTSVGTGGAGRPIYYIWMLLSTTDPVITLLDVNYP